MADMIVAGAGTSAANGTYTESGTENGRPKYVKSTWNIAWKNTYWGILLSTLGRYKSTDDVATPDLCTTWVVSGGASPAPTVTAASSSQNLTLSCAAGSYSLTGTAATLTYTGSAQNLTLSCGAGSLALTGSTATFEVKRNYVLVCSGATYPDIVVSGAGTSAANGTYSFLVMLESKPVYTKGDGYNIWWDSSYHYWTIYHASIGEYYTSTEDVATPDLVTTWTIGAEGSAPVPTVTTSPAITYTLTGSPVTLTVQRNYTLACGTGSYALTGSSTSFEVKRNFTLACASGSYAVTGSDVTLSVKRNYTLACSAGSYALTGMNVDLLAQFHYTLACNSGSYLLTGTPVSLTSARSLACNSGAYTLTGLEADLFKGLVLPCGNGSYILTGSPATINSARTFVLGMGSYVLVGTDAGLYILTATPDCRTYTIPFEDREWAIPAELRTYTIPFEDREWAIPAELRTYTIPFEDRTLEVRCH